MMLIFWNEGVCKSSFTFNNVKCIFGLALDHSLAHLNACAP